MTLLARFPILVLATVLVSVAGFCVSQQSIMLLFVAGIAAAISWYVTEGPRGRTLPRWLANGLVIGASVLATMELFADPSRVPGIVGRFAVWLAIIKFYDRRSPRDHGQLLMLSLLLVLVGCLQTQDLLFGLILLVYVVLAGVTLMVFQIYIGRERAGERRRREVLGVSVVRPIRGRHPGLDFTLVASMIIVTAVTMSAALFVVLPRGFGRGALTPWFRAPSPLRVTGYTDVVDLDANSRISDSAEIVCEVTLTDERGDPAPLAGPLLLRGAVLSRYESGRGRWRTSVDPSVPYETGLRAIEWADLRGPGLGSVIRQRFDFRRPTETVFALYLPIGLETSERSSLRYAPETQVARLAEGRGVWSYEVTSLIRPDALAVRGAAWSRPPIERRRSWYADPTGAVERFARQTLDRANLGPRPDGDGAYAWDVQAAQAMARTLQSAPFEYTLDIGDVVRDGTDPIVSFLYQSQRGHCEYFASALTAMCHTLDINARVVTGFIAHRYDPDVEAWVVLASDAHAWVEVRAGPYRYVAIDPTPPGVLDEDDRSRRSLRARIGWLYRRLEGTWTTGVVQYDERIRSRLIGAIDDHWSARLRAAAGAVGDWMARVNRAFLFGPVGYIWLGLVAFALVLAVMVAGRLVRRRRRLRATLGLGRRRDDASQRALRQLGFYLDMLELLESAGLSKPAWRPPLAHADELERTRPAVAALVRDLTRRYYRARYSGEGPAPADRVSGEEILAALRRSLSERGT